MMVIFWRSIALSAVPLWPLISPEFSNYSIPALSAQPLGEHWFSSATRHDFSTFRFTPNSHFALPTPATSQWPKAKETPQTPSPTTWLPFKSPPQLEQREKVILLIWSAPVGGGSPMGRWATVQMVPLPSDLLSAGLGFFCRKQWGDSGNGNVALVWGAGLIKD